MKKLLGILVLGLLLSGNAYAGLSLVCKGNKVTVDRKYIYEYFGSGAINKYEITKKSDSVIMGFLEGSSFDYYVYLDLRAKSLQVDKIDRKTNKSGVYTKYCN